MRCPRGLVGLKVSRDSRSGTLEREKERPLVDPTSIDLSIVLGLNAYRACNWASPPDVVKYVQSHLRQSFHEKFALECEWNVFNWT
ncbi:hypothetical protein NDU88_000061 [Pleurodeles waltl]|uniref:Uncharacterized protein n=1 Tax=Pleurodeles waltl TaxID=8319 RepID=A0AAV7U4A8_PLEWA|nr:hypothetical protein NDU88_000061 [Pleurodeles waltl]